jgi:putative oxidoreductase
VRYRDTFACFLHKPVAFILAGDMALAYFIAHFPRSFFPAVNGGDAAVLFCFVFFYIFFAGGGAWSRVRP